MPRSAIIWTRSRKLSLNVMYHLTHRMMISWSKCRPLNRSCAEVGSVIPAVIARIPSLSTVCTRTVGLGAKEVLGAAPKLARTGARQGARCSDMLERSASRSSKEGRIKACDPKGIENPDALGLRFNCKNRSLLYDSNAKSALKCSSLRFNCK